MKSYPSPQPMRIDFIMQKATLTKITGMAFLFLSLNLLLCCITAGFFQFFIKDCPTAQEFSKTYSPVILWLGIIAEAIGGISIIQLLYGIPSLLIMVVLRKWPYCGGLLIGMGLTFVCYFITTIMMLILNFTLTP